MQTYGPKDLCLTERMDLLGLQTAESDKRRSGADVPHDVFDPPL